MGILAVVFVVWKWRQNQNSKSVINLHSLPLSSSILHSFFLCFTTGNNITTSPTTTTTSNTTELALLIEEKGETLQVIAESMEINDLDENKANLDVQLKEVEEEHKDVVGVVHFLMDQKKDVDNQIHDLVSQLHEVKRQRDENQSQPGENNKKYSKKKQDEKECLDTKTKQIEKNLQDTDTLSKFIFCGLTIVTEKKKVLENLKLQINTQLEEIEKERDEIQKKVRPFRDINTRGDPFIS